MKDGAARAVLRDTWLRGQRCVELQRDGKRTIFVCTRCRIRCYSDAALVDHLQGNLHARLSAALMSEKNCGSRGHGEELTIVVRGWEEEGLANFGDRSADHPGGIRGGAQNVSTGPSGVRAPSKTSLEWIGSGELFFSVRFAGAAPVVNSAWFYWKGKQCPQSSWQAGQSGGIVYAVVMFPYSDIIGRGGDWKPWSADAKPARAEAEDRVFLALPSTDPQTSSPKANIGATPDHLALAVFTANSSASVQTVIDKSVCQLELEKQNPVVSKEATSRVFRRSCKRKQAKVVERLCFICHQRMTSGKDVAALLNLQTKQMVCGSRNKRGVFHVYHISCLIDWISMCELKSVTGQLDHRIDHSRKLTRTRRAIIDQPLNASIQEDSGALSHASNEGAIFCPECQGTGLHLRGAQLERPRYRLAQVFDWILELIQARKAWADNPRKQDMSRCGLLFRDELQVNSESPKSVSQREEELSLFMCIQYSVCYGKPYDAKVELFEAILIFWIETILLAGSSAVSRTCALLFRLAEFLTGKAPLRGELSLPLAVGFVQ